MKDQITVAFDTETTGTQEGSRIVEIAAIALNKESVLDQFVLGVNPGMPLPADAAEVNNITDDMLADCPDAGDALKDFFSWLPGTELVAHYAQFDTGMISWEAGRFNVDIPEDLTVIDTCKIAKAVGETPNNKLVTLAEHYSLEANGRLHTAVADADLCRQYYNLMRGGVYDEAVPWHEAGHRYKFTDDLPESLKDLPTLVAEAKDLTFSYQDAKGNTTERTITPYGWAEGPNGFMFHGLCHLRNERRSFRADRMIS